MPSAGCPSPSALRSGGDVMLAPAARWHLLHSGLCAHSRDIPGTAPVAGKLSAHPEWTNSRWFLGMGPGFVYNVSLRGLCARPQNKLGSGVARTKE
eukprot:gene9261-biopygen12206